MSDVGCGCLSSLLVSFVLSCCSLFDRYLTQKYIRTDDWKVISGISISAELQCFAFTMDIPDDITPEGLLVLAQAHANDPHWMTYLMSNDPELGTAIQSGDVNKIRNIMMQRFLKGHKKQYAKQKELMEIERDPDNPEHQKRIADAIRLKNVEQQRLLAMEHFPEAFAQVTMLYVNITINDNPIKAFVDSGAQSTIMTARCAEQVGIMRFLDTLFAGEARGVGTSKILGRIHMTQMKFGGTYFPVSITVLEGGDVDFLLGLDMLRRYRAVLDLGRNVLRMDGSNGPEEQPFLGEHEVGRDAFGGSNSKVDRKSASASDSGASAATGHSDHPSNNNASASSASAASPIPSVGSQSTAAATNAASAGAGANSGVSASANTAQGPLDWEHRLDQLQALGFSRIEADRALQSAEGNVDLAASLLFASR
jgi:DNA damage-inducible protein 1